MGETFKDWFLFFALLPPLPPCSFLNIDVTAGSLAALLDCEDWSHILRLEELVTRSLTTPQSCHTRPGFLTCSSLEVTETILG